MTNSIFTVLKYEEIQKFKGWAEENYIVGTYINETWHPVTRFFCELKNVQETIDESVFLNVEISATRGEANGTTDKETNRQN